MSYNYVVLYSQFHWDVPLEMNVADVCCGRRAGKNPDGIAIYYEDDTGNTSPLSYGELQSASNRLSNLLRELGVTNREIAKKFTSEYGKCSLIIYSE